MNRVLILVTITCLTAVSHAATFLTLQFPTGISFDLPKNWVVLSKNKTITLDTYIKAVLPKVNGDVKFQANLKNDYGQPIATVQVYYWNSQTSQSDVEDFTTFDVTEYNDAMQEQMQSQLRAIGSEVLSWGGTQKYSLGRLSVLTSEYVRPSSLIAGNFHVRVSRVYSGDDSISFVSSYHLGQPLSGGPIIDQKGNVIGVAVSKLVEEGVESFNFGIKASILKTFARSNNLTFLPPNNRDLSDRELGQLITNATLYRVLDDSGPNKAKDC